MRKTLAAAALGATLMGGTIVGAATVLPAVVGAQSSTTTPSTTPSAGTDAAAHQQRHTDRLNSSLQPLVDNGTITTTQRDAVVGALSGMEHGMGGRGMGGMRGGIGAASEAVASALGIDVATLRTEVMAGKSLATIASEKGVDVQDVVDALTTELNAKIDEAVTAGKLTAEQATERKADVAERVTDMVNGTLPLGKGRGHGNRMEGTQAPAQNQGTNLPGRSAAATQTT